jgi:Flp pilus assembly protein TadD
LGRLAFLTGDYGWSLNLLQLTAQVQPQNPEVLYDLGEAFYSAGRVPDARIAVQNALQTGAAFSRTDEAKRFLAMTDLADKPAQALTAQSQVEAILKSAPDYVPALMVKAAIAEQKSDLPTVERTYENILNRYPDFGPAQKQLAILYAKDPNNNAKAYALAVKARQAFPDDPVVTKTLGAILIQKGDYDRAVNLLKESAAKNSADAEVFYYLGAAQFQLKSRAESKVNLQQALTLKLSGQQAASARQMLAELK